MPQTKDLQKTSLSFFWLLLTKLWNSHCDCGSIQWDSSLFHLRNFKDFWKFFKWSSFCHNSCSVTELLLQPFKIWCWTSLMKFLICHEYSSTSPTDLKSFSWSKCKKLKVKVKDTRVGRDGANFAHWSLVLTYNAGININISLCISGDGCNISKAQAFCFCLYKYLCHCYDGRHTHKCLLIDWKSFVYAYANHVRIGHKSNIRKHINIS